MGEREDAGGTNLGDEEGAASVDAIHEVVRLDGGLGRVGERDSRGVVDDDIDSAKLLSRLLHRLVVGASQSAPHSSPAPGLYAPPRFAPHAGCPPQEAEPSLQLRQSPLLQCRSSRVAWDGPSRCSLPRISCDLVCERARDARLGCNSHVGALTRQSQSDG